MNPSLQFLCVLLLLVGSGLVSCGNTSEQNKNAETTSQQEAVPSSEKLRLMIAVVNQGSMFEDSLTGPCDAALNLIAQEHPQFELVTLRQRNDAIQELENKGGNPTAAAVATHLKVDRLLFINIMRLENMLRVALIMTKAPAYDQKQEGVGYALIRYRNERTGKRIYDTALLEALQRAIAQAVGNPSLFGSVRPAPALVVGGIHFRDMSMKPKWQLFENKIPVSYEAILSIFDAIKNAPNYVAYDIDSRDSMYAMRNLYMVENYQAPTPIEMSILEQFDVSYIISGSFTRNTKDNATLILQLGELKQGQYREVATEQTSVQADTKEALMTAVREVAVKLIQK